MNCIKGKEIKPLKSAAGWYMGTLTEEGMPNCRVSMMYYKTPEEAYKHMWEDYRVCMENDFCNGGRMCYACPNE